jgi:PemK-like, MazF-like toxin of type II toxin-antitoxin system
VTRVVSASRLLWWPEPAAGDIVWCHFPDGVSARPKPRPALVVQVFDDDAPQFTVQVAYGTSQRTTSLYRGEFAISRTNHPVAYESANLSFDTKFDLRQILELPFSTEWFSVPPAAPHGQVPTLGTLHPSMVRAVQAAFKAASA